MSVLLVSNSLDVHADAVEQELSRRSIACLRLDTDRFDTDRITISFGYESRISIKGHSLFLEEIESVLYRRPGILETGVSNAHQRKFAESELNELLRQIYFCLGHARWVSDYMALEKARRKLPQLKIAKECGLAVPLTLATNSPEAVRRFCTECNGQVVYKTLHAPVIQPYDDPELWSVPTSLLDMGHMAKIDLIRHTGGIFQKFIEKAYELRVTVIGEDVFAAKIDSQKDPVARVDWRDAVARGLIEVTAYTLPEVVANQCRLILRRYGLLFGAIDLIRTPDGEYVFLEINCNGQWLWVEDLTGQALLSSMVSLLTTPKP